MIQAIVLPAAMAAVRTLAFVALVATLASTARADESAAWAALRQGGVVALMRHGDAPGVGDPPGWRLDDCATQRNLSERGRGDASAVGVRLREQRVLVAKVLSSPWCRCIDTARLVAVGEVQVEPAFANAYVLSDRRESLAAEGRAVIGRWRGPGVLLVVSHGENIRTLTGRSPATAELVVVAPGATGGALRLVGTVAAPIC
ncbi:MAG: histidine phosphatase family protein [Caldimonas sp.]